MQCHDPPPPSSCCARAGLYLVHTVAHGTRTHESQGSLTKPTYLACHFSCIKSILANEITSLIFKMHTAFW
jgi:hypothetical protein